MPSDWASAPHSVPSRNERLRGVIRHVQALILTRCKLCWRITAAVFVTILAVEAAILGPSIHNYERDRLDEFSRAAEAAIRAAVAASQPGSDRMRETAGGLVGIAGIAGIALVDAAGRPVAMAGRSDQVVDADLGGGATGYRQVSGDALLLRVPVSIPDANAVLALVETPELGAMMTDFLWRIAGLIGLIAAVVTVATMLVLRFLILARLVALESAVSAAAAVPQDAARFQVRAAGSDELGALTGNVDRLLRATTAAFNAAQRREEEVLQLADSLEQRVSERTAQLEAARQAAEAASRAKSEFLANMSHELRTPLNAVIGFSEIIRDERLGPVGTPRYLDYAGDIWRSGRHLLEVIQDVLDLSRIEAGHLDLDESDVDLSQVIAEAVSIVLPLAESRGVSVEAPRPIPTVARADARRLREVALNLLANAINFSLRGGIVRAGLVCGSDGSCALFVADEGIGIAAKDLDLVMEPFGQVSHVEARSHQGTGLGLPLTKRFVEMHGGRLELESEPGRGTKAFAWIPATRICSAELRGEQGS